MGCKPKKMISKQVIKYRPNWCSGGLNLQYYDTLTGTYEATPQLGLKAQYSWLASPKRAITTTNNSDVIFPLPPTTQVAPPGITPGMAAVFTNAVVYNGHSVFIDQGVNTGSLQPCGKVTCTVDWLFKDPQCSYLAPNMVSEPGQFTHPPMGA